MRRYLSILLLLLPVLTRAQERLTLEDAVARTLQHNFDIQVADIAVQQAVRNNTIGNAGFLPNISFNTNLTKNVNNVRSELANGTSQNNPKAINTGYNPFIAVNWAIFDGGKMFVVKRQLNQIEALTEVQLRYQVQAMVSRTIQMYAQVVYQQQKLVAIDTALYLAKTRIDIANMKFQSGAGAKIDLLQARVDYNARRADSLLFITDYTALTDSLKVLMGDNTDKMYKVDDSLQFNLSLQPVDKERLQEINLSIAAARYNASISHLDADIARTYFLPTVTLNSSLSYSRTSNSVGFALFNQAYGVNSTLGLSVPIFYGGNIRRQAKVASLQAMRDDLLYEKQNTVIGRAFRTAWRKYEIAVAAYKLERENILIAKENLDVQLARFRVGIGNTLESREAENSFVLALLRLYVTAYGVKINETIVMELQNQLVQTTD
jgi:outer membrane protein TolC